MAVRRWLRTSARRRRGGVSLAEPVHGPAVTAGSDNGARWTGLLLAAGMLLASGCLAVLSVVYRERFERFEEWGYAGAFLISIVNNATVLFPAVGWAVVVALGTALNPFLLGPVSGAGAAIGELTGYAVGVTGRELLSGTRGYRWLRGLAERWGGLAVFVFAAMPLPMDIAGMWAGSVRYPLWRFLLWCALGKTIKMTALSLGAYYGINWLLSLLRAP